MTKLPCNKPNCWCTHEGCEIGWITQHKDVTVTRKDGTTHTYQDAYVIPCPTCQPEKAEMFRTAKSREDLQKKILAFGKGNNDNNATKVM